MTSESALQAQVRAVLEQFNELVSNKNMDVLAEFAPDEDVLLVGSEVGEVAKGQPALEAFFGRVFAREASFSWIWDRIEVAQAGNLAWFFAEGVVTLSTREAQRRGPYRISGVLERLDRRWVWRQYHGSEPVKANSQNKNEDSDNRG